MGKKWFDETFLPSLFGYAGIGTSKRISEKQADCFIRQNGVKSKQHTNIGYYGTSYVVCTTYHYEWNCREIEVMHSIKGYTISFGMTEEEKNIRIKEETKRQDEKDIDRHRRTKERRPDKYNSLLEKAANNFCVAIKLLDASAACEDDETFDFDFSDFLFAEKEFYKYYFA